MQGNVRQHAQNCEWCKKSKAKAKPMTAELKLIKATYPLELVYMDYLTIELGKGDKNVKNLIITDHFKRYA